MLFSRATCFLAILVLGGCASWFVDQPKTQGDPQNAAAYGYQPLDPLPVRMKYAGKLTNLRVLQALPDETMRIAVAQVDGKAGVSYGIAKLGYAGNSYVVTLDYVKFTTNSFPVKTQKEEQTGRTLATLVKDNEANVIVPVYVGVGLRLTTHVYVNEGTVDLGNLFALGVAAQAKQVTGTLTIQT